MRDSLKTSLKYNQSGDLVPNDDQKDKLRKCLEWCKTWRSRLGIHPDFIIVLEYIGAKDYLMLMDDELGYYNRFTIYIADDAFTESDKDLESVCAHELLHVVMWPFRKFCTEVAPEHKDAIELREETVVTQLEWAFGRLLDLHGVEPWQKNT